MTIGKLLLDGKKKSLKVTFTNKNGKTVSMQANDLSTSLVSLKATKIDALEGLEVELDEVQGQPKRIRRPGETWESPPVRIDNRQTTQHSNQQQNRRDTLPKQRDFHNPYNFIPALPRVIDHPDLGDHHPVGHGTYHADRWSGRIAVKLTTVTPLLIPDAANATGDDHKTYPLRVDAAGNPYLPPTSIKGMLRSAYEVVTDSRLSIFEKHDDRLAYRMPAQVGPIIPARVEQTANGLALRIMETSFLGHAAKLPRYEKNGQPPDKGERRAALKYEGLNQLPKHRDPVWVQVSTKGTVTAIRERQSVSSPGNDWEKGWVCITGANISGKKNERVFLESPSNKLMSVTMEIRDLWEQLIKNYQKTHDKDLERRQKQGQRADTYLGRDPGKTSWSRHVYDERELSLQEGTLCYVELDGHQVKAVMPVSISRRLYDLSPEHLLDHSLRPAVSMEQLSPSDRVFGWVKQSKGNKQPSKVAYKGNLRISPVKCLSTQPIEAFGGAGLPLAILGQPKPEQARFYIASDKQGIPLRDGSNKKTAYQNYNQGIRGRKAYPHHANLPPAHWTNPLEDRTQINQDGYFQEYHRPGDQRDDQNRSIQAWVKPNTTFSFDIDVTNLSSVELGALLWLLNLPSEHYHRLGGGKPFGFGSIRLDLDWDNTDLRKGQDWQEYYTSLIPLENVNSKEVEKTVTLFQKVFEEAYGNGKEFNNIPLIQAFCRSAQGFDDKLPIHYPRARQQGQTGAVPPHPEGKAFEWFVANERVGGPKAALPPLWDETGLPILPLR